MRGDEHACAATGMDKAGLRQMREGMSHRMPVHAKARGKLGLRGQSHAGTCMAKRDLPFQRLGDLAPQGRSRHAPPPLSWKFHQRFAPLTSVLR